MLDVLQKDHFTQDQPFHEIAGYNGLLFFCFAFTANLRRVDAIDPNAGFCFQTGPRVGFHRECVAVIDLDHLGGHGACYNGGGPGGALVQEAAQDYGEDRKLREVIEKVVRIYRRGNQEKRAHLIGFLNGADPGEG